MRKSLIVFIALLTACSAVAPAAVAGSGVGASGAAASVTQDDPTCEFPLEVEDATGEEIRLEEAPDSVVGLSPNDAQLLFEIGADETVDGIPVGEYTAYLEADEALDITEEDGLTVVDEQVIDREPDLVLAANSMAGNDVIDQLREAGLTVYVFPTEESVEGVAENVRLTGELTGECDGAEETLEWMDERLEAIEEMTQSEDRPLAYYEMGDGYTAGQGTFQDEILTTAGVENLGAAAGIEGWDVISDEVVVEEDPDWIVYGEFWAEPPVSEAVMETTAYEDEQLVTINDNFMSQPGPLVVYAIEEIAEAVHADAEAEADSDVEDESDDAGDAESDDASDVASDDTGDADDTDAANDDASESDDAAESIPGFGVPAGVAALVLSVGFLNRRR